MFNDGGVQLIAATYHRYVEMLEADEGLPVLGWPLAFERDQATHRYDSGQGPTRAASFHSSPQVHDVNRDGHDDVAVVDSDGNIYWVAVGAYGRYLHDYQITVPKLKVRNAATPASLAAMKTHMPFPPGEERLVQRAGRGRR
jgi:hypothetical protein